MTLRNNKFKSPRKMNNTRVGKVWTSVTHKLIDTLIYFYDYFKNNGYYPSCREAAKHFKVTHSAIEHRMWSLEQLGFIERPYKKARALKFLKDKSQWRATSDEKILSMQRDTALRFLKRTES